MDLAGLEPTTSALQVRCSPELSYRPKVPPPSLAGGYSITPGQASTRPSVRCGPHHANELHLPAREKKRARIGAQQIESNESSPYLRNSIAANNVGASVPPLRAGLLSREMKARVDCGNADPPCVSALLCRCSGAEHRSGARWWKKESNLHVPHGSHLKMLRAWSDYSRHPWRLRASARTADRRRNRTVSASRPGIARSTHTTIRRRNAGLRLADCDNYAIG